MPIWIFQQTINTPLPTVWSLLADFPVGKPSAKQPFLLSDYNVTAIEGTEQSYTIHYEMQGSKQQMFAFIDQLKHEVGLQGQWWYRGVYQLERQGDTTLLTLSVYNVAPGLGRWAARLMVLGQKGEHRKGFQKLVGRMEEAVILNNNL